MTDVTKNGATGFFLTLMLCFCAVIFIASQGSNIQEIKAAKEHIKADSVPIRYIGDNFKIL